ncbi:hypothetical protein DJ010_11685 [Nocardioides silvaticus]|uniref:Uncharacterized protein n=1 Tax=Nocardioides silvaticus TaxID=2201891 RepID=A0A316TLE9_9ACTN|nr:hypothetical protein [Nocardioides silvaticus]PWN03024.1 hypothetical protein DJ010_11685 [Nocardioides silvaticus]
MTGLGREVVVRVRPAPGRCLTRTTAMSTGMLAALVVVELVTADSVERYACALVGAVVASAVGLACRTWSCWSYSVRLATGGLAATILVGQVMVSSLGGPGGPAARWHLDGVAVAAVAVLVLVLAAAAPRPDETRRHPYAL